MQTQLLDSPHCSIKLIETWGRDERIIEAARMSTDKGFLGWNPESLYRCATCGYTMTVPHNDPAIRIQHEVPMPIDVVMPPAGAPIMPSPRVIHNMTYVSGHNGDAKLLGYLYGHKHFTPFEMAGCIFEVQAPIFVFREWHRHRTQSYNELSARYTELPDMFYIPSIARIMQSRQDAINKQASGGQAFTELEARHRQDEIARAYKASRMAYVDLMSMGVAREVARVVVPVGQISRMRASANLRNWLQFLELRMNPAAQWEIRQYANAVHDLLQFHFPRTLQLFDHAA